jgi:hypothetical protein
MFDLITYLYTANERALRHDEHPCKRLLAIGSRNRQQEIGSKNINRHCAGMNASLMKVLILSTKELTKCFSSRNCGET